MYKLIYDYYIIKYCNNIIIYYHSYYDENSSRKY